MTLGFVLIQILGKTKIEQFRSGKLQVEVDSAKAETEFVQNQAAAAIDAKNMTKEIKRKLQESLKQV